MAEEQIGSRKGDYEILGVLGAGGMGKVYKVRNVLSDRVEAMKVLLPNLTDQKDLVERFLREIKVLAGLSHPNIAGLSTALTIDNQLVMIMEYVEGTTLGSRVERGPISSGEAINYIDQVLAALSYAHQRQIIHRDIKPANMMLTPQGVVKLMDFGIARSGPDLGLTITGMTLGSLAYMSPEQVKCEAIDARSDLYSVGVSLYEMVTGQRPFKADSNFAIMQAHIKEVPRMPIEVKPDVPVGVNKIIVMAMEKDPAQRFQSADAFRNALQGVAAELGMAIPAARGATSATPVAAGSPTVRRSAPTVPATAVGGSLPSATSHQPQPAGAAAIPPAAGGGNRGLYITIGALVVVAVLVAAGFGVPRWFGTRANDAAKTAPQVQTDSSKAAPAAPAGAAVPVPAKQEPAAKPADPKKQPSAKPDKQEPANPGNAAPAPPPGPDPAEVAAVEQELDQLASRQAAINASLDSLQAQQQQQGYQLRGDIVAAQASMNSSLAKAQSAAEGQDLDRAKQYLKMADKQIEKLEAFLGH